MIKAMENFWRIIIIVFFALLLIVVLALIAASITGRADRAYSVLDQNSLIDVGNGQITPAIFAERYKPYMRLALADTSPPLLMIYYEVVENNKTWDIVYYYVWEDEINPDPFVHQLYRIFRAAYYGYPVRDIEYLQVSVEKNSGKVNLLLFETSPGEDFNVVISVHWVARYIRNENSGFDLILTDKDTGMLIRNQSGIEIWFEDTHPVLEVATWNHLSKLASKGRETVSKLMDAPLQNLSNNEYRSQKFVRKSQGDHTTSENPIERIIGIGAILILGVVSGFWVVRLLSNKTKNLQK